MHRVEHPRKGRGFVGSCGSPSRAQIGAIFTALLLSAPQTASPMPPPAPGNTRGLPESVRDELRQDPGLFYPRKGFRDVVERQKIQRRELVRELERKGHSRRSAETIASSRITTTRFCPVLCGIYADKPTPDWPVADLVDELFSLDYGATNTLGQPGSMREHYRDMSYGTFDLQGGVFGWFPLAENGLFYTSDDNGLGTDAASGEAGAFIRHTLQAADPTTDFRIYDNDGPDNVPNSGDDDGYVDLVMFVHPNEGGECGGSEIWSHSFSYSGWAQHGQAFVTNDMGANGQPLRVDDYVIMPALSCFAGRIEIGVFSHEFGHALGLPDLYDRTAYDPAGQVSTGGMGLYCLMAAGSYGGDYAHPATPTQMCAWSKEELGWLAPREVICDETLALYYQGDAAEAMKLWRGGDYSQNEWFLVENRQRKKWDQYLLGTGFLITHVDNNVLTQNDESCQLGNPCLTGHYQVMVIEADNQWEMQVAAPPVVGPWFGEATDFFSAENNAQWDDSTLPSARDHAGTATAISVHDIGPSGQKMLASFSVGQVCASTPSLSVISSRVSGGCDLDGFVDPGETVSLAVSIRNLPTAAPATGITGTLTSLNPMVSVVNGTAQFPDLGRGKFGAAILPFRIRASASAFCGATASLALELTADGGYDVSQNILVQLALDSLFVPMPSFVDDIESGNENGWHHYSYINEDDWSHNTNGNHTMFAIPGHSWFTAAPPTGKDVSLEPPAFLPSATTVVTFWQRYDTEDNWDGCVLELSLDGGETWIDVGDLTDVGYDDAVMVNPQSAISGRRCWNGLNASYPLFGAVNLSMAPWQGQTCLLRFRMATDLASTGVAIPGWNIDDYRVTNAAILRQQCEATPLCAGAETNAPVFAGLEVASNPNTPACDTIDLKWQAATDASPPITYLVYASTTSPVTTATPVVSTNLLKHRITGLTPNATYHFVVRARDSQGNVDANVVERSVTLACDAPDLVVDGMHATEVVSCDGDGLPDGGERLSLALTVRNSSGTHARAVGATLRSLSNRVWVEGPTASYGDLDAQHFEMGDQPFTIRIRSQTPCLTTATLALDLTAEGGYTVTRTFDLLLESNRVLVPLQFLDNMEGTEPNGFTHAALSGVDDWGYTTSGATSPTHAWFASDSPAIKNIALVSPLLYVSSSSVLSFRHKYVLEDTYDGAVLEISADGGATWQDIGNSYNSTRALVNPNGSPFARGALFWSGNSGGFVQVTVNLGSMTAPLGQPLYAGKSVLVRWRLGCNAANLTPAEGWWIDDISLTDSGTFETVCDDVPACDTTDLLQMTAPRLTVLEQNRPNPMNPATTIHYVVAPEDAGHVTLILYDVAGRLVRRLVDAWQEQGPYRVTWNGVDAAGVRVASGIYVYELQAGSRRLTRKLTVLQ
ncbi:MAG TPA: M6 family metalloprotease domain-containing protein [Candidatus Krumholzibacteria bacterium]|nr:M6 family metalloprotease domain-containing protein [Candidatus Krumholzibacteria bacterium]